MATWYSEAIHANIFIEGFVRAVMYISTLNLAIPCAHQSLNALALNAALL